MMKTIITLIITFVIFGCLFNVGDYYLTKNKYCNDAIKLNSSNYPFIDVYSYEWVLSGDMAQKNITYIIKC